MRLLPSRRARARKVAAALVIGGLIWLFYTAARSSVLLRQGRAIEARSASFARDIYLGAPDAPALTYLAMGDSTGAGWGAAKVEATYPYLLARSIARRGFRVRLVNLARGGATARDVRDNQLAALKQFAPDVVTLSVGANDATHSTDADSYRRDMRAIVSALNSSSAHQILVADTPDMWLAPALPMPIAWAAARRARAQNAILARLVRDSRVQVVPLYARGKLDARVDPKLYASDWFHPSSRGYARWAKLFVESWPRS